MRHAVVRPLTRWNSPELSAFPDGYGSVFMEVADNMPSAFHPRSSRHRFDRATSLAGVAKRLNQVTAQLRGTPASMSQCVACAVLVRME
jgi:hypothetical protein